MKKSNCLFGAIAIRLRLGGELKWRPGWRRHGWKGFLGNPWGHWFVLLPKGTKLSYSAQNKNLPVWNQLWFAGHVKRRAD